jgi:hypothetical protein
VAPFARSRVSTRALALRARRSGTARAVADRMTLGERRSSSPVARAAIVYACWRRVASFLWRVAVAPVFDAFLLSAGAEVASARGPRGCATAG